MHNSAPERGRPDSPIHPARMSSAEVCTRFCGLACFNLKTAAALLALLLALTAVQCRAQDQDDDDEDAGTGGPFAFLTLTFDKQGNAEANLTLDEPPQDWRPFQAALGQALHCAPESFSNPAPNKYETQMLQRAPAKRQAELLKNLASFRLRQLHGNCSNVLEPNGWTVSGNLPLQPLASALAHEGKQNFLLNVTRPATAFAEHTPGDIQRLVTHNQVLTYRFSLTEAKPVPDLHLAYGFRKSDLIRQSAIALGFLLLPLLITLWMRRAALRGAAEDATAAWFSYFKTLQWCVNGTMLLWMVARTSIRQGLQDLIAFRLGDLGWQPALANTALTIVPPWFIYLLCLVFSYEVFVQVRGNRWKRHEFLLHQVCTLGSQFFPLMFVFCAIDFLRVAPKASVLLFLAAYFSRVVCVRVAAKVSGSIPEALTTGELRDRIFELARKAGVNIKHVFVLSAGKSQIANAYATKSSIVMFTDYLLKRLTKREVDAITGHELTHLRLAHPKKLGLTLIAAILFPTLFRAAWRLASSFLMGGFAAITGRAEPFTAFWLRFDAWLMGWSQLDLVLVASGFAIFYLRARIFERAADAGSLQLVGDPEAMITGLLKLSRLNLMPIQWGKVTGSIMTHPSTMKRIEHIAQTGNIAPDRLQQILAHHQLEEKTARASAQSIPQPDAPAADHYPVPESANHVLTTIVAARRATNNLWLLISAHVLPPALVVWSVHKLHLTGSFELAAYTAGALLVLIAYSLLTVSLGLRGRRQLRRAFTQKFLQEGIQLPDTDTHLIGFSPAATPRFYLAGYDWDTGFLILSRARLIFLGDKLRFALTPDQILSIRLGPAAPGWWTSHRIYLDWRDAENNRQGTFNLSPNEPTSVLKFRSQSKSLLTALETWQGNLSSYPTATTSLAALQSPSLGEVTSQSPKELSRGSKAFAMAVLILMVGYGVATLLSISPWYVFAVILLLRLYELIPHWRYREQPQTTSHPSSPPQAQVTAAR